jgi:hypothetical protein
MYRRPILWRERAALSRLPVLRLFTYIVVPLPLFSKKHLPFADQSAEGFSSTVSFAILPVKRNGTW